MIQKPYNISLRGSTIDANEPNEVSWSVSGDISTAYKIDILLNSDNSLVWSSGQITSYALKHTIPATTLTNGIEYKITVTIWNATLETATSYAEIFQTSSTPVVTVNTIGTVNSFSYLFSATYTQAESVAIRNYTVNLYDSNQNLINTSGILTTTPLEYLFTNLQTETSYYIEFIATSTKGLTGTSGKVLFDVFFYRPKMNIHLEGMNIANAGIELSWYIAQIILKNTGGTFINNEKLDLTNGLLIGDEGFDISGDFTLKLWLENIPSKKDLLILNGENGKLTLQYDAVLGVFTLKKQITNGLTNTWISNSVAGQSYFVYIQQIGTSMNISSEVLV